MVAFAVVSLIREKRSKIDDVISRAILGAFSKLRKWTTNFVMSVRPSSVYPLGTSRLPLDGFPLHLIFWIYFDICPENSSFFKIGQEERVVYMKTNMFFFIISRSALLRMRNVSDKSCRENQNTHFMLSNPFSTRSKC